MKKKNSSKDRAVSPVASRVSSLASAKSPFSLAGAVPSARFRSGAEICAGRTHAQGVNAHAFDPQEHGLEQLIAQHFDRVFIALHGRFGEDGTVQGALEYLVFPYR